MRAGHCHWCLKLVAQPLALDPCIASKLWDVGATFKHLATCQPRPLPFLRSRAIQPNHPRLLSIGPSVGRATFACPDSNTLLSLVAGEPLPKLSSLSRDPGESLEGQGEGVFVKEALDPSQRQRQRQQRGRPPFSPSALAPWGVAAAVKLEQLVEPLGGDFGSRLRLKRRILQEVKQLRIGLS